MRFTVNIESGNAAVTAPGAGSELARILRELADRLEGYDNPGHHAGALIDYNGNRVGTWEWSA